MKKILLCVLLILFCSGVVFGGEFEDTLKKAEQGDAGFQYSLGFMYNVGKGVHHDDKQAVYWYSKAAEQGHEWAQFTLGMMYSKGQGAPHDDKLAYVWFSMYGDQNIIDLCERRLPPQQLAEAKAIVKKMQQEIDNK